MAGFDLVLLVRGSMESLPSDIVQDIVSRVPAETVLECKSVCKRWGTIFHGTNFTNMHLCRQLDHLHGSDNETDSLATKVESSLFFACCIDDPNSYTTLLFHGGQLSDSIGIDEKYVYNQKLKRIHHTPMHTDPISDHFVGSCNGLVCAFRVHNLVLDPIYICNPLTREYAYLPELVVNKEDVDDPDRIVDGEVDLYYNVACGFGYVGSTNEYKVVRIHYLDYEEGNIEVYTLGSGCGWRAVGRVPYRLHTRNGTGIYANDAIYWISRNNVMAFDLADEEFRLLPVPPCLQNPKPRPNDTYGLVALGRRLCVYMDKSRLEFWFLVKSSDSKETWRMEFDVDYEEAVASDSRKRNFRPILISGRKLSFQPILLTENGEIIFLYARSVLYCYDTRTTVLKMMSDEASSRYFKAVEAIAHVNTFASLEAMGELSKRHRVPPRRVGESCADVIDELDRVALD